jgi:hypothetical protein
MSKTDKPKRRGPGRPPAEKRRIPMTFRVSPKLNDQILARAEETGRSVTQELEMLVAQALFNEKSVGSRAWQIGEDVMHALGRVGSTYSWLGEIDASEPLDDPKVYKFAMVEAIIALAEHWPGGPTRSDIGDIDMTLRFALNSIARRYEEREQLEGKQ